MKVKTQKLLARLMLTAANSIREQELKTMKSSKKLSALGHGITVEDIRLMESVQNIQHWVFRALCAKHKISISTADTYWFFTQTSFKPSWYRV